LGISDCQEKLEPFLSTHHVILVVTRSKSEALSIINPDSTSHFSCRRDPIRLGYCHIIGLKLNEYDYVNIPWSMWCILLYDFIFGQLNGVVFLEQS
jgi:hypothetical protein